MFVAFNPSTYFSHCFSVYFKTTTSDLPDLYEIMFTKWSKLVVANAIVCGAASVFMQSPLLDFKGSYADQMGGRFYLYNMAGAN